MKVSSSDTIVILRDTQKEDSIKTIKKSWEDKKPGRVEKAKLSRKKFAILEKQKRGEPLDSTFKVSYNLTFKDNELQLINEPRQRKAKEEDVKKDAKGKPIPKRNKSPINW